MSSFAAGDESAYVKLPESVQKQRLMKRKKRKVRLSNCCPLMSLPVLCPMSRFVALWSGPA
jgi:hypothetical protein